jgi:thiamine-phosphate pyrophosphorylase
MMPVMTGVGDDAAVTLMRVARRINAGATRGKLRAVFRKSRAINRKAARRGAPRLPVLFFVTDMSRTADPVAVALRLPRGAGILLRHYGAAGRAALARRLASVARARGLRLLIAADPPLARAVGACGVHWPEALMHRARGRRAGLTTVAAHGWAGLVRARRVGADAAFLSPVFPTKSGADKHPLGVLRFSALAHASPVPVYALGGITEAAARRLMGSGAAGLAAVDALTGKARPGKV